MGHLLGRCCSVLFLRTTRLRGSRPLMSPVRFCVQTDFAVFVAVRMCLHHLMPKPVYFDVDAIQTLITPATTPFAMISIPGPPGLVTGTAVVCFVVLLLLLCVCFQRLLFAGDQAYILLRDGHLDFHTAPPELCRNRLGRICLLSRCFTSTVGNHHKAY